MKTITKQVFRDLQDNAVKLVEQIESLDRDNFEAIPCNEATDQFCKSLINMDAEELDYVFNKLANTFTLMNKELQDFNVINAMPMLRVCCYMECAQEAWKNRISN